MKKQKKFFTVVPLQEILYNEDGSIRLNKLTSGHYQPVGNSRLEYWDTRFPIIPVLHGYAEPEDLIQVVAITPDNPFAAYHLEELRQEVEQVASEKGLLHCQFCPVSIPDAGDVNTQIDLFQKLLDYVQSDDLLYGCLTYGTKPMTVAELMAIQYAYRTLDNVTIDCLVYGEVKWKIKQNYIYDITALIQLDEITRMLAERRVKNPREIIDGILTL